MAQVSGARAVAAGIVVMAKRNPSYPSPQAKAVLTLA